MLARNIIAIGASAGGFEAIPKIMSAFPLDLEAAVFITIHLAERSQGLLPELLNRSGSLPAIHPWEETSIEMGHIYVAPPDYHLILTPETVHLGHGPKENLQRPCINAMFRSAAAAHGERVVGVLLTGMLDDGAAGLWEIQQRGGLTVVQDPEEAAFRSMPENAIRGLNVQYIVRLAEMGALLTRFTMGDIANCERAGASLRREQPTVQACPACGGVMRRFVLGCVIEYTCHIGHRFGLKTIIAEKSSVIERAILRALSQSEELSVLLQEVQSSADAETSVAIWKELERRKQDQEMLQGMMEHSVMPPL